jgi:hypothetical protein
VSDSVHLLVPFASSASSGCIEVLPKLSLPRLEKLLARMNLADTDAGEATSLSMPHERVLARACHLPTNDGRIPWAAWEVQQARRDPGTDGWARITPCHWHVGPNHVAMSHPQELHLDAPDSQALLAAMRPYFEQDGIALEYAAPTLWLARGEVFRNMTSASLDRVVGRTIDPWMPRTGEAVIVRRLQQEMQMLLYTHEVNEERVAGGLPPVNSFWVSDTGALPAAVAAAPPPGLQMTHYLRDAALLEDWQAWVEGWQQVDGQECARLLGRLDAGDPVTLTLCGDSNAQTWTAQPGHSLMKRLRAMVRPDKTLDILKAL